MCPGLLPNRENVNLFLSNALAQYEPFQQGTQTMGSAIERDINGQDSNGKHAISIGWSRVVLKLHISEFRAFCLLYGGTVGDATDALWSSLTNVSSWKFDATQISPQGLLLNVSCIVTCSVALCSLNCSNYCQKRMLAEAIVFPFGVMRLWQQRHAIVGTSVRIVMQKCCHGSSTARSPGTVSVRQHTAKRISATGDT